MRRIGDSGLSGRSTSSAWPLALVWLVVIIYASLFPFSGWHWPAGVAPWEPLRLPWPRYFIPFDITSNLGGYLPLGGLVALGLLRQGRSAGWAMLGGVLAGAMTSYTLELLQHLLPPRVPSLLDWVLNTAGALLGALLALLLQWWGALARWQVLRERWLERGSGAAMALLLLWPVALLFPAPVPLGLGQVAPQLRDAGLGLAEGVPWAEPFTHWLLGIRAPVDSLGPASEWITVALGLLAPCLIAFAAARPGWPRWGLALGAAALAAGATTLSTVLNFGPDHALAWTTGTALSAMVGATLLALALAWVGRRLVAALALIVLSVLVVLVNQAPTDPYLAQSLQGWEQGRFIRFHGVAQWVGWLWPYAGIGWLLARLGAGRSA